MRTVLAVVAVLCWPAPGSAQTSPFLPEPLHRDLANEISGDRAFESVRHLTHFHRTGGSRDFFAAAEWIRAAAAAAGLEDVKLVRQAARQPSWSGVSGEAWVLGPERTKIADYAEVAVSIADNSRTTHAEADLVDVGAGTAERDYEGRDVKGKVVLASGAAARVHQEAVWKRGALGVISWQTNRPEAMDAPDQVAWGRLPHAARDVEGVADGTPSTFAVMIAPRRARWLQKRMAAATGPLRVKVDIEAAFESPGQQAYVEGWIRGTEVGGREPSEARQVVLTAHIQEEMTSANDDGSGCASVLEIGRALARLIREGKLPRPRRDIRFWWVNEFASEEQYFRENPGQPRRMLVALNQDMVGARQSWGGRVQYASRLPWSLPHALDDVMESVLTMVRDGNTSLLTTRGTAHAQPFTREVVAVKGSREPFHARMVPYYDSTDHHAFTPAPIGVPATSLTNWPDEFIHSTGDDLEQLDATQLERNALVMAAVAWYFASAGEPEARALAPYVAARGASRLAADQARAMEHLMAAAAAARPAALRAARNLVRQSAAKEAAAVGSVRSLAAGPAVADGVARGVAALELARPAALSALDEAWTALTGQPAPADPAPTEAEQALARTVYAPVADLAKWQDASRQVKPIEGLHMIVAFEIRNFADGKRNGLEVYQAVAAEALSAGEWYYGRVTPEDVRELLERSVKAGAYTAKPAR
jgi:Peptidase family M28